MPETHLPHSVAPAGSPTASVPSLPWWVSVTVVVCVLLLTAGAIIAWVNPAMLSGSSDAPSATVQVYAGYLISRNLAVAVLLLISLLTGARRALSNIMLLAAVIQLLDACIDCVEERWAVVPIVLVLGALLFLGASTASPKNSTDTSFWRHPLGTE